MNGWVLFAVLWLSLSIPVAALIGRVIERAQRD